MEIFNKGVVYIEQSKDNIANGIKDVIRKNEELSVQMGNLRMKRESEWHNKMVVLEEILLRI